MLVEDGRVWVGGRKGVTALDVASWKSLALPEDLARLRYVRDIAMDAEGALWLAHDAGVSWRAAEGWRHLPAADLGLGGPPLSLLPERTGAIWLGGPGGLVRGRPGAFFPVALPPGSSLGEVTTLFRDSRGVLWVASNSHIHGGLLSHSDETGWRGYEVGRELHHASVNAITEARDGALWFATGFANRGAASILRDGSWERVSRGSEIDQRKVRTVFEDDEGWIWLGYEYDGAVVFDGSTWHELTADDGLAGDEVKIIRQDESGAYWIGTSNGLSVIDKEALLRHFSK